MGKGSTYRPVDRKKWDAAWARLEDAEIMCACNKKPCEGECREHNLSRSKDHVCPAAYSGD